MRDLTNAFKISARSCADVIGGLETLLTRYGVTRRIEFRGRKLSGEAVINAALIHLLEMPADAQEHALRAAIIRLEGVLQADEPVTFSPRASSPSEPVAEPDKTPKGYIKSRPKAPKERKRSSG